MGSRFNFTDFGFESEEQFQRAMTCGPIVRFEIRKASGDVRHAETRLEMAKTVRQTEVEQAMGETSMTRFIDDWVVLHEDTVAICKDRLAFLREMQAENF